MKQHLHLRQISFSSHSWQDLIELGLTQRPLAGEFHGLIKNVIKFKYDSSEYRLFLHHWMMTDEAQVNFKLKDLFAQPAFDLSADINTSQSLVLQTILVADEQAASELKRLGLPAQTINDPQWSLYFEIRKRQKIWALVIDLPDHKLELDRTYRFVSEITWEGQKALHVRSESQCLDLILI